MAEITRLRSPDSYPNGPVNVMVSGFARGTHSGNCPLGGSSGQLSNWPCESHGVRFCPWDPFWKLSAGRFLRTVIQMAL